MYIYFIIKLLNKCHAPYHNFMIISQRNYFLIFRELYVIINKFKRSRIKIADFCFHFEYFPKSNLFSTLILQVEFFQYPQYLFKQIPKKISILLILDSFVVYKIC